MTKLYVGANREFQPQGKTRCEEAFLKEKEDRYILFLLSISCKDKFSIRCETYKRKTTIYFSNTQFKRIYKHVSFSIS